MSGTDPSNEAARWLRYAREDLATAVALRGEEGFVPRQVCWLAQQAAEKAIKAALVRLQLEFPRTHDLDLLLNLLPDDWSLHAQAIDLTQLSEWAVEARYPGDWPEATVSDAQTAVQAAESTVNAVAADLSRKR
jgi:HEPN domain-containing protein